MNVEKQRKAKAYKEVDYFVKRHGSIINLSSAVRDSILPHRFARLSIGDDRLIIYPSDDDGDYRVSICACQRQAKICVFYASTLVHIPFGKRLYGHKRGDWSIVIRLKDAE